MGMRWVLALAVAAALFPAVRAPAAAAGGGFVIFCGYSHSLMDDPIVDPGQPGASHMRVSGSTFARAFAGLIRMSVLKRDGRGWTMDELWD